VSAAQQNWIMMDTMRGLVTQSGNGARLRANTAEAEANTNDFGPTATGFQSLGNMSASAPFIYIAIRRGPMKTPTSGTSVFSPIAATNTTGTTNTTGFPVDMQISNYRLGDSHFTVDRLRGVSSTSTESLNWLITDGTGAEVTSSGVGMSRLFNNTGFQTVTYYNSASTVYWNFGRAPSFMDVVCYTGNGTSGATQSHNLGVVPEMMIVKIRNDVASWLVYHKDVGNTKAMALNSTIAPVTNSGYWNDTTPTSSVFTLGSIAGTNGSGKTFVAYLFASCPGVSKVGSYSGTGATQTISCGFAARFVMIKRTDSTGNWVVWDTARGMVAGTDPRLELNTTNTETNANWVYTDASGFQIVTTDATVNASGGSYLYLAIS
jgi:hypothetical protein